MEIQTTDSIEEAIEELLSNIETDLNRIRQLLAQRKNANSDTRRKRNLEALNNAKAWYKSTFQKKK